MMNALLKLAQKFLPKETTQLIELGTRMVSNLDTAEERKAVLDYALRSLENDGKMSVTSWSKFGSMLGILGGNGNDE